MIFSKSCTVLLMTSVLYLKFVIIRSKHWQRELETPRSSSKSEWWVSAATLAQPSLITMSFEAATDPLRGVAVNVIKIPITGTTVSGMSIPVSRMSTSNGSSRVSVAIEPGEGVELIRVCSTSKREMMTDSLSHRPPCNSTWMRWNLRDATTSAAMSRQELTWLTFLRGGWNLIFMEKDCSGTSLVEMRYLEPTIFFKKQDIWMVNVNLHGTTYAPRLCTCDCGYLLASCLNDIFIKRSYLLRVLDLHMDHRASHLRIVIRKHTLNFDRPLSMELQANPGWISSYSFKPNGWRSAAWHWTKYVSRYIPALSGKLDAKVPTPRSELRDRSWIESQPVHDLPAATSLVLVMSRLGGPSPGHNIVWHESSEIQTKNQNQKATKVSVGG